MHGRAGLGDAVQPRVDNLQIFSMEHLKSLEEFPPGQGADTLGMKRAVDAALMPHPEMVTSHNP